MKLSRIVLVNWYLFNPIDIDLEGNTALIGDNGAGKSTVIDAIQVVLFGGNQRHIKFNAQSSEGRSSRDLKTYCLGVYRPEENSRLRDECESYLALCFKGNDGRFVNLLVGVEARHDEAKADVKLLAIFEGNKRISYRDFIKSNPDGSYVTNDIHTSLSKLKLEGFDLNTFNKMGDYFSAVSKAIGPKEIHDWISPETLSNTLSRSLSLSEITSVSSFVENFVLEEKKINVQTLVNARNRYGDLLEEITRDRKKLEALRPINLKFKSSLANARKSISYEWLSAELTINNLYEAIEEKRDKRGDKYKEIRKISKDIRENKRRHNQLSKEIIALHKELANNEIKTEETNITARIEGLSLKRLMLDESLAKLSTQLSSLGDVDLSADKIDSSNLKQLSSLLQEGHPDFLAIDTCLKELNGQLESLKEHCYNESLRLSTQQGNLAREMQQLDGFIQAAKQGRGALMPKTKVVMEALRKEGIDVNPVCELAFVTDKTWQPAIEAALGSNTEALIVHPKDEKRAYAIYRQLKRDEGNVYGVTIAKTGKYEKWLNNIKPNSAAELVESDNKYALAYLHSKLGDFLRLDTEEELKTHRGITIDGMVSTSTSVSRNKLPQILKLVKDQTDNIAIWEVSLKSKELQKDDIKTRIEKRKKNHDAFTNFISFAGDNETSILDINKQIDALDGETLALNDKLNSLDLLSVHKKEEELMGLEKKQNFGVLLKESDMDNRSTLKTLAFGLKEDEVLIKKSKLPESLAARQKLEANPHFCQQFTNDLDEPSEDSLTKGKAAYKRSLDQFADAKQKLDEYNQVNDGVLKDGLNLTIENLDPIIDYVENHIVFIETHGLAKHEKEAEKAYKDVNDAFRTDMINRLRDSFAFMKSQFSTLNKALRNKEFHHEIYQFTYKKKGEYAELVKYIEESSDLSRASVNDLFDQMPEGVVKQIERLVDSQNIGDSTIEDYRKYFTYDVRVTNKNKGSETGVMLSKLLKTGSGGEKQSPFYVAIASSLASAWQTLKKPGESSGLTLLDEAFNKLSENNLINAIKFMNEVGLQLIIAVPSERETVFRPVMDTVVYFTKEDRAVDVEIDIITHKGRRILMEANPALRNLSDLSDETNGVIEVVAAINTDETRA